MLKSYEITNFYKLTNKENIIDINTKIDNKKPGRSSFLMNLNFFGGYKKKS